MLDTARNFIKMPKLREVVDLMSSVKFNALHLHLTDAQSWPLELDEFPEFASQAAMGGKTYSRQEIRSLVHYAKIRNIRIIPEIESPGHAPQRFGQKNILEKYGNIVQCTGI